MIGVFIVGVSAQIKNYPLMLTGRCIYGIGAESLNVLQSAMISLWFNGDKNLAFAFGITLCLARFGDFIALSTSNYLAKIFGSYKYILWCGVAVCGLSFLANFFYFVMDKFAEKTLKRKTVGAADKIRLKDIIHFDKRIWPLAILCTAFYGGVLPFLAISTKFLNEKYNISDDVAGVYSSVIILSTMILAPILGKTVDLIGRRPYVALVGSIALIPSHLILGLTYFTPIVPIIIIGLAFALVPAALWPSISLITNTEHSGTAFGLTTALQNLGLAVINAVVGAIIDKAGYTWCMIFFVVMDTIGVIASFTLVIMDNNMGRDLAITAKQKEEKDSLSERTKLVNN